MCYWRFENSGVLRAGPLFKRLSMCVDLCGVICSVVWFVVVKKYLCCNVYCFGALWGTCEQAWMQRYQVVGLNVTSVGLIQT